MARGPVGVEDRPSGRCLTDGEAGETRIDDWFAASIDVITKSGFEMLVAQPKPGDILFRKGRLAKIRHYGVCVGVNEVVHACIDAGVVISQTFAEFADGNDVFVSPAPEHRSSDRKETVARARRALGREYKLLSHNCEHFASLCATGKASSTQLQGWATAIFTTAGLAAVVLASQSDEDE